MLRPLPLLVPVALLCLTGCVYGYWAVATTTTLGTAPPHTLIPPDSVALYFGNTTMNDTDYVSIAFLEVQGAKNDDSHELLRQARKRASRLGANAVINIDFGQTTRSRGELISDVHYSTDGDPNTNSETEEYTSNVLRGIAVYVKPR